jgi:hypothetical protein
LCKHFHFHLKNVNDSVFQVPVLYSSKQFFWKKFVSILYMARHGYILLDKSDPEKVHPGPQHWFYIFSCVKQLPAPIEFLLGFRLGFVIDLTWIPAPVRYIFCYGYRYNANSRTGTSTYIIEQITYETSFRYR